MNHLRNSNSPYLLQHAENPVEWYPWGPEALETAKKEDKPILLSIGYSSCHWCHVMAHESFEHPDVAEIMNKCFINIKLDREERPDIDQIYMDAIQAMGLHGGWPLNVFLTPDQKPFYGGTYFPKDGWKKLLQNVAEAFDKHRDQLIESAEKFTTAINRKDSEKYIFAKSDQIDLDQVLKSYENIKDRFDHKLGGINKAPKFPMPSLWQYLLTYYFVSKDHIAKDHAIFTLECIANGGIYDQIGGGFSRYSVDAEWHVPHFEKMLYDNGQLMSLYALAYSLTGHQKFKEVLEETFDWLEREMTAGNGGLYSALDADSEGVEGKFYTWSYEEIMQLGAGHADIICEYYDVHSDGNWEETNVLRVVTGLDNLAQKHDLSEEELTNIIKNFKQKALTKRAERIRPGLDDKILTSWNALALKGLVDTANALERHDVLEKAGKVYQFISTELIDGEDLLHQKGSEVKGFAEDYATVIQAFIAYYEATSEVASLELAERLMNKSIDEFYDTSENLFYYTSSESESLIARKKELFDNVIPSSNSIMTENLLKLGKLTYNDRFVDMASGIIGQVVPLIEKEPEYMSQWAISAMLASYKSPEIAITGDQYDEFRKEILSKFVPLKVIAASSTSADIPKLLQGKKPEQNKTTYFVCFNKTCQKPVFEKEEALQQILN